MKCSWPGFIWATKSSLIFLMSSALASSTVNRLGFLVLGSRSDGRIIAVLMGLSSSGLGLGDGSRRGAGQFPVVFGIGGDEHVLVAILGNPAKLAFALRHVENAHLIGDQILLWVHDRHVHEIEQIERALDRP